MRQRRPGIVSVFPFRREGTDLIVTDVVPDFPLSVLSFRVGVRFDFVPPVSQSLATSHVFSSVFADYSLPVFFDVVVPIEFGR
jgi:hypothetical protein